MCPDRRGVTALDLLLEFKYVSLKNLKLTGEQVRKKTHDELAALPLVKAQLRAAADQTQQYAAALRDRYGLTDLRAFAVVALGLERVVWQPVEQRDIQSAPGKGPP